MLSDVAVEPDGKSHLEIWKDEEFIREKHHLTQHCNWLSQNNIPISYETITPFCRQFSNLLKAKKIIDYDCV